MATIFRLWGTPVLDMFATVHNTHLPQFMSPVLEPQPLLIDAVSQDWQGRSMYMFPPFPLLNKVIQKIRTTQEGEVILTAPWWLSQTLVAAQIAAFLYEIFDTHGLSPQTIQGYRSCIASVLSGTGMAAAVQAKTISVMIMSLELQRPRLTPVLPQWDLGIVLEALSKPPYELLREPLLSI